MGCLGVWRWGREEGFSCSLQGRREGHGVRFGECWVGGRVWGELGIWGCRGKGGSGQTVSQQVVQNPVQFF